MGNTIFVQLSDEQIVRLIQELHRADGATTVKANDGTNVVLINVSED
jgi:hypothetical protein